MVDPKDSQSIQMSISEILNSALSHEKTVRQDAESKVESLATRNFPEFLYNLATVLADEGQATKIRQMASTLIKKLITASPEFKAVWQKSLDSTSKDQIKNLILSTLATQFKEVRAAAALVIAGICKVDQPLNEKWPSLISSLSQSSYHENKNIKLAAIESLGYICEELSVGNLDSTSVDDILSAIIQNTTNFINDVEIVKAHLKAFYNVIKHAGKNFSKQVRVL
jgi:importin subunit beta-1